MFKVLNNLKYSKILFKINNEKLSRKYSVSKKKFSYKSHLNWLKKILSSRKTKIYFYLVNKTIVGTIRTEAKKDQKYLSWAIGKEYRGRNLGKKMLIAFVKRHGKKFIAKIHRNNFASLKMCHSAGFKVYREGKKFMYFKKL